MVEVTLPYGYEPRDYQIPVLKALDEGVKRVVWCCHRRAGKDLTIFNWLIKELWRKRQTAFLIFPTYAQSKKIIWDGMTKDGIRFVDFIPKELIEKKNESELKVRFKNGSLLQLLGSDNVDRLVGTNPSICVFSEYALQSPRAWEFLRPILAENDGRAIFISTPRGKNHFYDLFFHAKENDTWFAEKLSVRETGAIGEDEIERERLDGMSEDLIQQEFYVSFNMGMEGSYYGKYLDALQSEGRLANVIYETNVNVHTAWDLGIGDSTCIIFFQIIGQEIHIIDSYENQGEGLQHYAKILQDKPYIYGTHFAPHDIEVRELGTGLSRLEVAREIGINFTKIVNIALEDGIEAVRGIFPKLWIDGKKNQYLIKCLTNYRKAFNDKYNVYSNRPVHDWSSHFCDAIRYMALGYKSISGKRMTSADTMRLRQENLGINTNDNQPFGDIDQHLHMPGVIRNG